MHTVSYKVLQIKHIIYTQQEHSLRLDTDTYIHIMTKPSSSTARVNSSPEEMPNSSSLVWFLSKLFPVGRALQRRCQINEHESSQYRLLFFFFFSSSSSYSYTLLFSWCFYPEKDQMCAAEMKELKFHEWQEYKEPAVRRSKVRAVVFSTALYTRMDQSCMFAMTERDR